MKFTPTPLAGLYVVEIEPVVDGRGFFGRSFCMRDFKVHGLEPTVAQCNISFNKKAGTLRGIHFQVAPHEEAKLVRCTHGAIYDVAVDVRPNSRTYLQSYAIELTPENLRMMYIPRGFGHGFQTLIDNSEILYLMSEFYHPESARGFRWNDPTLGIAWPVANPTISDKDEAYPLIPRAFGKP